MFEVKHKDIMKNTFPLLFFTISLFVLGCQSEKTPEIPKPDIEIGMFSNQNSYRLTLSENQEWLLFDKRDTIKGTIYLSVFQGETWSTPQAASFSGQFDDMDPFIAPDQQTVFFMSRRPLFKGDSATDWNLWQVKRLGEGFDDPIPLPANINTEYSELFPTVDAKNNLFFAVNTPEGHGGNDLWMANSTRDGLWEDPLLLPTPINSSASDSNPTINSDGDSIIYASARNNNVNLYLLVKQRRKWSDPISFNSKVNTSSVEGAGFIRNGKLYFFRAETSGERRSNLYELPLKSSLD